jgi:hypothetical protein
LNTNDLVVSAKAKVLLPTPRGFVVRFPTREINVFNRNICHRLVSFQPG